MMSLSDRDLKESVTNWPSASNSRQNSCSRFGSIFIFASLQLLLDSPWQNRISNIEKALRSGLAACKKPAQVADVRVLGAIGAVDVVCRD
jgi:4-aminobutyrate aminotransferase-like enzyme